MTQLNMPIEIQAIVPDARPWGRLVDEGYQIPSGQFVWQGTDRLGQGVNHTPWGCDPLSTGNASCDPFFVLDGDGPGFDSGGNRDAANSTLTKGAAINDYDATVLHPAFALVDGLKCGVMSFPDLNSDRYLGMENRLRARLKLMASAALAGELATGWASDGPSFADAEVLDPSGSMLEAAYIIEQHLATSLSGGQGLIHMPPGLVAAAVASFWVYQTPSGLRTMTGHKVVADAGYNGLYGPDDLEDGSVWIVGTGPIGYRIGDPMFLGQNDGSTLDPFHNYRTRISEAYAQLAFDPCAVGATQIDTASAFASNFVTP